MAGTQRKARDGKSMALALPRGGFLDKAREALREVGLYAADDRGAWHYWATTVRVGREVVPAIRATDDDREVLGEVARQLVVASIAFRLVKAR
jgi:hypothetical protein